MFFLFFLFHASFLGSLFNKKTDNKNKEEYNKAGNSEQKFGDYSNQEGEEEAFNQPIVEGDYIFIDYDAPEPGDPSQEKGL